jgi:hypothetical protein
MAALLFSAMTSLDGYVADADGEFGWAAPDEQVHAFVNDLMRPVGTHLYGRRLYEVMQYWETADTETGRRRSSRTSPGSGRPPTRSCTRGRSDRSRRRGRGSSATSTPGPSGG